MIFSKIKTVIAPQLRPTNINNILIQKMNNIIKILQTLEKTSGRSDKENILKQNYNNQKLKDYSIKARKETIKNMYR